MLDSNIGLGYRQGLFGGLLAMNLIQRKGFENRGKSAVISHA